MTRAQIMLEGLAFGESPRWHQGRLWFCNWGSQQVIALGPDGTAEVVARIPTTLPYSIDWLPDGRMLVVSGQEARILRQEPDGSLVTHADLSAIVGVFNEIVVDGRGNAYVNGTAIALVTPAGAARAVASGLEFGNGMAVTPDNSSLIVAESHGNRLTAFDIGADGAVWYADVPGRHCVRVAEGGRVLQTVEADRGCFACMLGGGDGRTLFLLAAEWHGMEQMMSPARTGQVLAVRVATPRAGWP